MEIEYNFLNYNIKIVKSHDLFSIRFPHKIVSPMLRLYYFRSLVNGS